jgi:hypothetical protein
MPHLLPSLPWLLARAGAKRSRLGQIGDDDIPRVLQSTQALTASLRPLAQERVHAYQALVGAGAAPLLSPAYLLAQPVQLALMLQPDFALAPMGLVHVANTIVREGKPDLCASFEAKAHVRDCTVGTKGNVRFALHTALRQTAGTFHVVSHYSYRRRGLRENAHGKGSSSDPRPISPLDAGFQGNAPETSMEWAFSSDGEQQDLHFSASAGRRYARVSGDWNPIHLWPITAKALGFRQPIAHGMLMAARAEAMVSALTPEHAHRQLEVQFKRPLLLPGQAKLTYAQLPQAIHMKLESVQHNTQETIFTATLQ